MTVPEQPQHDPISLSKDGGGGAEPRPGIDFDPYRFGLPEHPIAPEYAPPGYVPPSFPATPPPPAGMPPAGYPQYPGYPGPGAPQFPPVPPPPPYLGYGGPQHQAPPGHGKAVTSLVLGIVSIVLCWLTIFNAIPVVLAIVFGSLGVRESRFKPNREGRAMAIAGIVCAVVGAILSVIITVVIYTKFRDCLQLSPGSSDYRACIEDHL